jgi:hypothetical protein
MRNKKHWRASRRKSQPRFQLHNYINECWALSVECIVDDCHINEHKQWRLIALLATKDKGSMLDSIFLQATNNIRENESE